MTDGENMDFKYNRLLKELSSNLIRSVGILKELRECDVELTEDEEQTIFIMCTSLEMILDLENEIKRE